MLFTRAQCKSYNADKHSIGIVLGTSTKGSIKTMYRLFRDSERYSAESDIEDDDDKLQFEHRSKHRTVIEKRRGGTAKKHIAPIVKQRQPKVSTARGRVRSHKTATGVVRRRQKQCTAVRKRRCARASRPPTRRKRYQNIDTVHRSQPKCQSGHTHPSYNSSHKTLVTPRTAPII